MSLYGVAFCGGCKTFNRVVSLFVAGNRCVIYSNFDKLEGDHFKACVSVLGMCCAG